MALLWADGFDHYGTTPNGGRTAMLAGAWAQIANGNVEPPFVSSDVARTGAYSLKLQYNRHAAGGSQAMIARRVLGADKTEFGCGFGVYFENIPDTNNVHGVGIRDGANTEICWLFVQSDGSIALSRSDVIIVTSAPVLGASSWNHIEFKTFIDASAGAMEVRVNGVAVINETNIDLGSVPAAAIRWGTNNFLGGDLDWYVDDIATWDTTGSYNNDFMGPVRVETIFCDADTAQSDWTVVGAADAHDAVNEVPPDMADNNYLVSDTVDQSTELGFPELPEEATTIKGVFIPALARISDAGTGNLQVSLVGASAGVDSGPDTPLTTAYTYWPNVFEENPDTAAAWTKAELEAALVRIVKTA